MNSVNLLPTALRVSSSQRDASSSVTENPRGNVLRGTRLSGSYRKSSILESGMYTTPSADDADEL